MFLFARIRMHLHATRLLRRSSRCRHARDCAGTTAVEYLVLIGMLVLVALAGVRVFRDKVRAKAEEEARCVLSLEECNGSTKGSGSRPNSESNGVLFGVGGAYPSSLFSGGVGPT